MTPSYKEAPHSIQVLLEDYCRQDPYGLKPSTLYSNIVGTLETNSVPITAVLFEVSESLVWMIKDHAAKNPKKTLTPVKTFPII